MSYTVTIFHCVVFGRIGADNDILCWEHLIFLKHSGRMADPYNVFLSVENNAFTIILKPNEHFK